MHACELCMAKRTLRVTVQGLQEVDASEMGPWYLDNSGHMHYKPFNLPLKCTILDKYFVSVKEHQTLSFSPSCMFRKFIKFEAKALDIQVHPYFEGRHRLEI